MNNTTIEQQKQTKSCKVTKTHITPPKTKESIITKTLRKVQLIKGSVRYDINKGEWALLDQNFNPVKHFTHAVMKDVTFRAEKITSKVKHTGCGGAWEENVESFIGVATGYIRENSYGTDGHGFHNLRFDGTNFMDEAGSKLEKAEVVRLMPERRALYK